MHHEGLSGGELEVHLLKYRAQTQLSAERVAPICEIHLADFIGICLQQHGHIHIAQRGLDAVFIAEVRQADDHAVVFAVMLFEEIMIDHALLRGFHRAVFYAILFNFEQRNAHLCGGGTHIRVGGFDYGTRKKAAICNQQCKLHDTYLHNIRTESEVQSCINSTFCYNIITKLLFWQSFSLIVLHIVRIFIIPCISMHVFCAERQNRNRLTDRE